MTGAKTEPERPPLPQRRANVMTFVLLTFIATWTMWIAASAFFPDSLAFASLPGTIMPAIMALWLTKRESEQSFRDLVARLFKWRVSVWYYVFALTFMAAVKLSAASLYRLDTGAWPAFGTTSLIVMLVGALFSTPVQAGEEIGWRGFMLQRLALRMGFAWASLLVGVTWAAWHLPMFFMPGGDMVGQSFPLFVLMVTALSVPMAWLYRRTDGSLLLTMIMHAAVNNTAAIVPSRSPADPDHVFLLFATPIGWLTTIILWVAAAILFIRLRASRT
ncbi:MAG TPA: type II CAAX endopeptidase family protein [Sphingomicrobium sp.]|nr:type II CAAX endopeptidase family protein [Sphingomicrobium sp.]